MKKLTKKNYDYFWPENYIPWVPENEWMNDVCLMLLQKWWWWKKVKVFFLICTQVEWKKQFLIQKFFSNKKPLKMTIFFLFLLRQNVSRWHHYNFNDNNQMMMIIIIIIWNQERVKIMVMMMFNNYNYHHHLDGGGYGSIVIDLKKMCNLLVLALSLFRYGVIVVWWKTSIENHSFILWLAIRACSKKGFFLSFCWLLFIFVFFLSLDDTTEWLNWYILCFISFHLFSS